MRKETLRDLAPGLERIRNAGRPARLFGWLMVCLLGFALVAEAAPDDRAAALLKKMPGIGTILKNLGFLKPDQQ